MDCICKPSLITLTAFKFSVCTKLDAVEAFILQKQLKSYDILLAAIMLVITGTNWLCGHSFT